MIPSKDFGFILLIGVCFQTAPVFGLLRTGSFSNFVQDVIFAVKWFCIPLAFFYFKTLFQSAYSERLRPYFKLMIGGAFFFITVNMLLGALGLGQPFYHAGYENALGTKGFIYAGNELTILVLALGFLIAAYFKQNRKHVTNLIFFLCFLFFAALITSKTVLAGVFIVFLIPYISAIPAKFKAKWVRRLFYFTIVGIPLIVYAFYKGIVETGVIKDLQYKARINNYDFLTVLLSNRNHFVAEGWDLFMHNYSVSEKIFGVGETFYVDHVSNIAEIDFITWLYSAGIIGLLVLLFVVAYWFMNARLLMTIKKYPYAKSVFVFLIFICFVANLAGHVFSSGIAAFQLAFALALMFYKPKNTIQSPNDSRLYCRFKWGEHVNHDL